MKGIDIIAIASRWFHLGSVIVLVGGAFFLRYVLMPAAEAIDANEHDKLRDRLMAKWKSIVHPAIGVLLLTGAFNVYYRFDKGMPVVAYHGLLTIKIMLALFVMFVASALVGKSKGLEPLRANRKKWLTISLVAAMLIVMASGAMRFLPDKGADGAVSQRAPSSR